MTSTEPISDLAVGANDLLADDRLLAAARQGSAAAFSVLYSRHRSLAVSIARRTLNPSERSFAEDVAEVAFSRVFNALRNGRGPDDTLAPYLTTSVRREAWLTQRRLRRHKEVVRRWAVDEPVATADDADGELAGSALADSDRSLGSHVLLSEAFASLPDRWRSVLWLSEVEGRAPSAVGPMLGISAGSAAALAYRARQGLMAAYLAAYRASAPEGCQDLTPRLGRYVAAGRVTEGFDDVVAHLEGCSSCRDAIRGVDVLGTGLRGLVPFGVLTTGWWARGLGAGAGGASGAGAAGTAGVVGVGSTRRSARGIDASSASSANGAALVALGGVLVALVLAIVAIGRLGAGDPGSAAVSLTRERGQVAPVPERRDPVAASRPRSTPSETTLPIGGSSVPPALGAATPAPADATPRRAAAPEPSGTTWAPPAPSVAPPVVDASRPTTVPVTEPRAVPTPPVPSTTTAPTTSTTLARPEPPGPAMSGRVVRVPAGSGADEGIGGLAVWLLAPDGHHVAETATGPDGRWSVPTLADGRFLVVVRVPWQYRLLGESAAPAGSGIWNALIGDLRFDGPPLQLGDLRLVDR